MSFQSVTITVAIVILILCLIFVGVSLYNNKYNTQYPPVQADCPDYWVNDVDDGLTILLIKNAYSYCDLTDSDKIIVALEGELKSLKSKFNSKKSIPKLWA